MHMPPPPPLPRFEHTHNTPTPCRQHARRLQSGHAAAGGARPRPSRSMPGGSGAAQAGGGEGLPLPRGARTWGVRGWGVGGAGGFPSLERRACMCLCVWWGGGGTLFATTRTGRQAGRRLPKAGAPEWALVPSAIHTHTHTPHTHINHPPQEANEDFQAGDPEWALLNYLKAGEMGAELGQSNAAWMLTEGERGGGCRLPAARCRCSLPAAGRSSHPLWC